MLTARIGARRIDVGNGAFFDNGDEMIEVIEMVHVLVTHDMRAELQNGVFDKIQKIHSEQNLFVQKDT